MLEPSEYIKIFTGLLAILNPIGAIPVFISLTSEFTPDDRKQNAKVTGVTVAIVMIIVTFTGQHILNFFGISMPSFRVGGGILILLMAISMLHGRLPGPKQRKTEMEIAAHKSSIAVVPLGIPILAGPGSISTVVLYSNMASGWQHSCVLALFAILLGTIVFGLLSLAPKISEVLGGIGINIFTRVMGLIMAAIGVEFIAHGLIKLFPGLG